MHGMRIALKGTFGLGTTLMWCGLAIATLTAALFALSAAQVGLALFALRALLDRRFTA